VLECGRSETWHPLFCHFVVWCNLSHVLLLRLHTTGEQAHVGAIRASKGWTCSCLVDDLMQHSSSGCRFWNVPKTCKTILCLADDLMQRSSFWLQVLECAKDMQDNTFVTSKIDIFTGMSDFDDLKYQFSAKPGCKSVSW
jgi:hypothetical protein